MPPICSSAWRARPIAVSAIWLHVLPLLPAPHDDKRGVPGAMLRAGLSGGSTPWCVVSGLAPAAWAVPASAAPARNTALRLTGSQRFFCSFRLIAPKSMNGRIKRT